MGSTGPSGSGCLCPARENTNADPSTAVEERVHQRMNGMNMLVRSLYLA